MIIAIHTLIYSDDAAATRAFLTEVLRWPSVSDAEGLCGPRGLVDLRDRSQ